MCLTELIGPSRTLQLNGENVKQIKFVAMYIIAMLHVVLAVMRISVIYKFLSLGL